MKNLIRKFGDGYRQASDAVSASREFPYFASGPEVSGAVAYMFRHPILSAKVMGLSKQYRAGLNAADKV